MAFDHQAIYKAYAGTVISIDDTAGAFDKDGKSVSLDDSLVTKARTEIDEEAAKVKMLPLIGQKRILMLLIQ